MRDEVRGIQHLRAIASIAVVIDHTVVMSAFPKYFGREVWLTPYWLKGALGVELFFMISGFIMARIALAAGSLEPKVGVAEFFFRRAIRILPMMWLAIAAYAGMRLVGRAGAEYDMASYLRAAVLSPVGALEPLNIWTLRHEAIFYAVFALSLLTRARTPMLLVGWGLMPIVLAAVGAPPASAGVGPELLRSLFHPANVLFLAGYLFGCTVQRRRLAARLRLPAYPLWLLAVFLLAMAIGTVLNLEVDRIGATTVSALMFLPLLALGVLADGAHHPVWQLLGNASFAIYLFHPHFVSALLGVWARLAPNTPVGLVVVGTAVSTVAVCVGIYLLVERPLLRWLRRRVPPPARFARTAAATRPGDLSV